MTDALQRIKDGLVVSCQTPEGSPLRGKRLMGYMAEAAALAGARGIRTQGADDVRDIRASVDLPIIGLVKRITPDTRVIITPLLEDVEVLLAAGADIIAVDATSRPRANGLLGHEFVAAVKARFDVTVLADVDSLDAAMLAEQAGADAVASTLSGYTGGPVPKEPDLELLRRMADACSVPVLAEGRLNSPQLAAAAMTAGAWAVCVGSAISDPFTSTGWFVRDIDAAVNARVDGHRD